MCGQIVPIELLVPSLTEEISIRFRLIFLVWHGSVNFLSSKIEMNGYFFIIGEKSIWLGLKSFTEQLRWFGMSAIDLVWFDEPAQD
jgi:hypothetical protein